MLPANVQTMGINGFLILLSGMISVLTGCGTTNALIVARNSTTSSDLEITNQIAIVSHPNPRTEER
jgi:hypothetical protein